MMHRRAVGHRVKCIATISMGAWLVTQVHCCYLQALAVRAVGLAARVTAISLWGLA